MILHQLLFVLLIVGCFLSLSEAAEPSPLRKIRVAITSISGSMVPPWAANEAGTFKRHGLQVEVIATPSGIQGTNALIANELSFLQIAGGTTTGAAGGGAAAGVGAGSVAAGTASADGPS